MAELVNTSDVTVDSVPIEMLDYAYVGSCTDVKLVQKILAVLKSGKEGLYPDLIKFTEAKYLELLPPKERKKYEAMNHQTTNAEKYEAEQEIRQWAESANKSDQFVMLKSVKKDIPVRGTTCTPRPIETPTAEAPDMTARSSTTHADTKRYPCLANSQVMKLLNLRRENQVLNYSDIQREHIANQEKLKGNECFKMNENEKAVLHYSKSLAFDDSKAVIWANRAMTYVRMELFNYAEDDCSVALSLDASYVKALFRRGLVRFKMGKYAESISDFGHAMLLEPDNLELAKLWKSALDKYAEVPDAPVQGDGSSSAFMVSLLQSERDSLFPCDLSKWDCVASGSLQPCAGTSVATNCGLVEIPVYPDYSDSVVAIDEAAVQLSQKDSMAARYKDLGNKLIKSPSEAIKWYNLSLRCNREYVPALNNRAQANLTTKDYAQVVADSTVVLKLEPLNLKALYRRAVALHSLRRLDLALEDVVALLSMDRGNLQGAKLYTQILLDRARVLSIDGDASAAPDGKQDGVIRECTALLDFVRSYKATASTAAVDLDLKETTVRALLVRADAYIHTEVRWPLAVADVDQALLLDPANETAARLRDMLRAVEKERKATVSAPPVAAVAGFTTLPPSPPSDAWDANVTSASVKKDEKPSLPPTPPSGTTTKTPVVSGAKTTAPVTTNERDEKPSYSTSAAAAVSTPPRKASTTATTLKAVNSPLPEPSTPLHPPRTLSEFERVWRSMKGQPAMFARYLAIFKSNTFEKVIKESTSAECLSSIFAVWRDHFPDVDSRLASMKNFSKVAGFKFMLSVLPEEDLMAIRSALDNGLSSSGTDKEKVSVVRALYNM